MTYRPRRLRPHHNGSERWVIEAERADPFHGHHPEHSTPQEGTQ